MFEGVNVKVKKEINTLKDRGKVEILRTMKNENKMFSDESSSSSVSDNDDNDDNCNNIQILPKRRITKTEIIESKCNNNTNITHTNNEDNNTTTPIQTQYNSIANLNNTNNNNDDDDDDDYEHIDIDNDDGNGDDEYKPTIENIALTNYNKLQSQREAILYKKYIHAASDNSSHSDSENEPSAPKPLTTHKAKFIPQPTPHPPPNEPSPPLSSNTDTFTYLLKATQTKPKDISNESQLPSYESIDDTDDLNDISEYEKWKIRELTRIKRALQETQTKLNEDQELQHRRHLTDDEVRSENLKLGSNDTLRKFKSKLNYLQKYYHKGAFFQDESQLNDEHIYNRDYNLPTWEDSIDRTKLPSIMNKRRGNLFKKGQSKYTHLSNEDTTNFDVMFKVPEHIAKGLLKKTGGHK